ncbi:TetR/AcrR family transcriptional regulator [Sanguibacter antarcticus]|uniref:TetR family transcriptional regulator n=1 Tax=Sanguibacter antarcticus TaxID=372484 RepID=A0A2A9E3S4_9MICO|nr:TetR/AcrR family transcriptional regulator [Sanguibacter antarcticus]PFG32850.1 TetR family transcriptional regulator [Sanguibacter antarcticus]
MDVQQDEATVARPPRRRGRRRDSTRDDAILEAARELLVERGYENMTMDAVAERAGAGKATLYRRWDSKTDLIVDAITCHGYADLTVDNIPDTGSLRGDLLGLHHAKVRTDVDDLMAGLAAVVRDDPHVAAVFQRQFVQTRTRLMRDLLERADRRGEIPPGRDLDMIAIVGPAMISYQKVTTGAPLDHDFVLRLIDTVLVPLATAEHPTESTQL